MNKISNYILLFFLIFLLNCAYEPILKEQNYQFSINVSNDLKYYKNIIPCGISDKGVTRIKNLTSKNLKNIDKIIKENLIFSFKKI